MTGMFQGWFDDDPKTPASEKVVGGLERYRVKFGTPADLVLVNTKDACSVRDVEVRAVEYVRPNNFWVGRREALPPMPTEAPQPPQEPPTPLALLALIQHDFDTYDRRIAADGTEGWTLDTTASREALEGLREWVRGRVEG